MLRLPTAAAIPGSSRCLAPPPPRRGAALARATLASSVRPVVCPTRQTAAHATRDDDAPGDISAAATAAALTAATGGARTAQVGDVVAVHFTLRDESGETLDSSREHGEPITFEVGAGDVFGNELYQAFDAVVRGLAVGESTSLEAAGGEWDPGLLFTVPADHPEIERLSGRYKNVGGLAEGLVVELANGARAVVVKVVEGEAVTLDANDMLAGRRREFTLELVGIEPGRGGDSDEEGGER